MHELQRMQYLDAMGIDSFVPRVILPQCKAATVCELPVEVVDMQNASHALVDRDAGGDAGFRESDGIRGVDQAPGNTSGHLNSGHLKPASAIVSSLLEKTEQRPRRESSSTEPSSTESSHAKSSQTIETGRAASKPDGVNREHAAAENAGVGQAQDGGNEAADVPVENAEFSLSLWRVGENIQVVDSRQPGEALPTHKLLHNIVHGMKFYRDNLPGAEILHWPLVGAKDASWQAAEQMVQGFLDGKLAAHPTTTFWLMGRDATRAVLGSQIDYAQQQYQLVELPNYSAKAIVLPSLAEILYDAQLKKPVWLALKKLL
ncbi:hypothetical protein TDB9533_01681 [Thalassocella blandensis]|nr:hypothetical protein TDB9533_01681 [Thalassocella blandensis]